MLGVGSIRRTGFRGEKRMAQQSMDRGEELTRELYALAREERELRRQLGQRILDGQPVDDLRTRRRQLREDQEDLSAAVGQLAAIGL